MGSGGQPQQWKREDKPQRQQEQKQPGASPKVAPATVSTGGARAALARSLVGVLPLATGLSWCANYRRGHQSGCSCWSPAAGGMLPGVLPLPTSAKGRRAALARPSVGVLPLVAGRGWCAEQRTTSRGAPASGLVPTASSFCVTWRPLSPVGVCSSALLPLECATGLACPVAENSVAVRPCCGSRSRSEGGEEEAEAKEGKKKRRRGE